MGDMIKASGHLDLDNKPFHSGFGSPMGELDFPVNGDLSVFVDIALLQSVVTDITINLIRIIMRYLLTI